MSGLRILSWLFGGVGLLLPILYLEQEVSSHTGAVSGGHSCGLSAFAFLFWVVVVSGGSSALAAGFNGWDLLGRPKRSTARIFELCVLGVPALCAALLVAWFLIAAVAG